MVDPRARYELACLWIYEEFVREEGLIEKDEEEEKEQIEREPVVRNSYNESIMLLLNGFKERLDPKDK